MQNYNITATSKRCTSVNAYKETIARLIAANPMGCELHFTQMNLKLKEIFANDDCGNLNVVYDANFTFE
ncbi:MAG: hypothetical protein K2K75_02620 [Muribaculaceae bacterium]|nr:hypothetical protein [Muribaculaceae bacterium]